MDNKKNILISAGVALLVVVIGFAYFGRPITTVTEKVIQGERGQKGEDGRTFGAIPGNSIEGNIVTIGGVDNYFYKTAMTSAGLNGGTATGTVCVFPLPSASTTLVDYSARLTSNAPTTTGMLALYYTQGGYGTGTTKAIGGINDTTVNNGRLVGTSTTATTSSSASRGLLLQGSAGGDNGKNFLIFDLQNGSSPFTGSGVCRIQLKEL